MRALVDFPDDQLVELDGVARRRKSSRAALVREAVANFLKKERDGDGDWLTASAGLWKGKGYAEDGLEYQERLRSEW